MKRKGNLYESILDFNKLYNAFKIIKKNCKNKNGILNFSLTLNSNLFYILELLKNSEYEFGRYYIFLIKEPKYRIIMSQKISDKVVNHLLSKYVLIPILDTPLIDSNVATRKDKGTKEAFNYFIKYIKKIGLNKKIYVLKIDIKKFFYNIDHELLIEKLERKIKDKKILNLIKKVLDTTNLDYVNNEINRYKIEEIRKLNKLKISLEEKKVHINAVKEIPIYKKNKGIPIGNTSSQIFANFYLNDIDHYIKEVLKHKYYIRYMDDLIILSEDKKSLLNSFNIIEDLIISNRLETNKKSGIFLLNKGFSFLGYTFSIYNEKKIVKYNRNTSKRISKRLKNLWKYDFNSYLRSIASYKGYFIKSNTNYKFKFFNVRSNSMYEKYLEIKKKYDNQVIFIKSGKFYVTFDDDAVIINELLKYKIMENKVGFPINSMFKVKNTLSSKGLGYYVLEGNELSDYSIINNNYSDTLKESMESYEKKNKINKLLIKVEEKLNSDFELYIDE